MGIKFTPNGNNLFERGLLASSCEGLNIAEAFKTFLELVVISIVNANPFEKDTPKWKKREEKYFRLIDLRKDKNIPVQMLADLVNLMQQHHQEKKDIIGEMYEKFVSLGENGQFFTPHHIADMMSKMVGIENGGKVCDIACGSGKLLLGALRNNPRVKLYGVDIDRRCVMMALLNCYFYGGCGEFLVGNTLINEYSEGWRCNYGIIYELDLSKKSQLVSETEIKYEQKETQTEQVQAVQQSLF